MVQFPKDKYYNLHALWLVGQGKIDEAIELLRKRIHDFPLEHIPHLLLAVNLKKKELTLEACEECRRAIELKPDYYSAMTTWGEILLASGRLDEAAAKFQAALVVKKGNRNALIGLARISWQQKRYENAIALFQEVIQRSPWERAFLELSEVYSEIGRSDEAVIILKELVNWNPKFKEGFLRLGDKFSELGQFAEARTAWEAVLDAPNAASSSPNKFPELDRILEEAQGRLSGVAFPPKNSREANFKESTGE